MIYTLYQFNRERIVSRWIYQFLSFTVYINMTIMYIPLMGCFNSLYRWKDPNAKEKIVRISQNISMETLGYKLLAIVVGIGVLVHLFLSFLFTMTFFEVIKKKKAPRAQLSPQNDLFLLTIKSFMIGFDFVLNHKKYHWIPIVFCFFAFSFYLFRLNTYCSNLNSKQARCEMIMAAIVLWSFTVLLLSILLDLFLTFEGGFYLFIVGAAIILGYGSIKTFDNYDNLFVSFDNIDNYNAAMNYIMSYLFLIENTSRKKEIILKGYINYIEEKCLLSKCSLKQYLFYKEKKKPSTDKERKELQGYLYQHGRLLFETATSKFSSSIHLKIYYISFLYDKLSKRDLANNLISACNKKSPNLTDEFLLYCFETGISEREKESEDHSNEDISINLAHKNHCYHFNNDITQASLMYIEFWSAVLQSDNNDFAKLNDFGSKINKLVDNIKFHFNQIVKIKLNNQSQMFTYTQFLRYVLNDNDSANKILKKYNIDDEFNLLLSETKKMVSNNSINDHMMNENSYLRISSKNESFGLIINVSIPVCSLLGYTQNEIRGKCLEAILPDFLAKKALQFLQDNHKKYLSKLAEPITAEELSKELTFCKLFSFSINKSKYLMPISVLYSFIQSEEDNSMILIQLKEENVNKDLISKDGICYILTNEYFIIQNFTSNCSNILDLTTTEMSNTVDITFIIQEFHQEYLNSVIDLEYNTPEDKIALKKRILETKFKTLSNVTWNLSTSFCKSITLSERHLNRKDMLMSYDIITINNELLGYIFRFKAQINNCSSLEFGLDCKKQMMEYNKLEFQIDKMFLPEVGNHFSLNSDKMAYMFTNYKKDTDKNKFRDLVRSNAFSKLKHQIQSENKITSSSSSSVESSSLSSSKSNSISSNNYTTESFSEINANESSNLLKIKKPLMKSSNKNVAGANFNSESKIYYHVNLAKIKFMIYNYDLKMVQEIPNYEKICEIEQKLKLSDEQENKNYTYIKDNAELSLSKKNINGKLTSQRENNSQESISQDKLLNKQIQHALKNSEERDSMLKIKLSIVIILVFLFFFNVAFIMIYLMLNEEVIAHYYLISKGLKLLFNFSYGSYYARELTLLSTNDYKPLFGSDKEEYRRNVSGEILTLFNESISIINTLTGSMCFFEDDVVSKLDIENLTVKMIKKTRDVVSYNLSAKGAFYESLNALKDVAELSIEEAIPTNKFVFFFLNNSLTEINIGLTYQINIFETDMNRIKKKYRIDIISAFAVATLFSICSCLGVFYLLINIFKQKTAFLQIFIEINSNVKSLLQQKCEYFYKQLINNFNNDNEESEQFEDKLQLDSSFVSIKSSLSTISDSKSTTNKNKGKQKKMSGEQKTINLNIFVFFFFYELVILFAFIYLLMDFETIQIRESLFIHFNYLHWFYIQYFIIVREFIFHSDRDLIVNRYSIEAYSHSLHQRILSTKLAFLNNRESKENYLPSEVLHYFDYPFCNYSQEFFKEFYSHSNCHELMGNSSLYGNSYSFDYFINQLLFVKNFNFLLGNLKENKQFAYNNTLIGTSDYDELRKKYTNNPVEYELNNSLVLFNTKAMKDLSITVRFIFIPFFNDWLNQYAKGLKEEIKFFNVILIVIICIFSVLLISWFIFIWKPFEKQLNKTITNTKNMLSIIPTEVLCSIKDIQKLLNINQSVVGDKNIKRLQKKI